MKFIFNCLVFTILLSFNDVKNILIFTDNVDLNDSQTTFIRILTLLLRSVCGAL